MTDDAAPLSLADFDYELPEALIAQHPPPERSGGRMLIVDPARELLQDRTVKDLPALLKPEDLLVFNDTRVIPARLLGVKDSGGRVEVLIERITGADTALAHVRASKSPRLGTGLWLADGTVRAEVLGRQAALFELRFCTDDLLATLEAHGRMPLPPYIARDADGEDVERYQTVFGRVPGAVAAPTAGLHFDEALLAAIRERGVRTAQVTLHVGAGTFQPVRVERIDAHRMHAERIRVPPETVAAVAECRARGGRVVAVGTTVVRSLETAASGGELRAFEGESRLFITPGYRFAVVDAMLTNFHLPRSTLLMLVSAFAGRRRMLRAYAHAVAEAYRFFSYGDAMWIAARADDLPA